MNLSEHFKKRPPERAHNQSNCPFVKVRFAGLYPSKTQGANAFLRREFQTIAYFIVGIAVLLLLFLGWQIAFGFVMGAQYSDDQQNPDDTDRDAFVLNRLPEAQLQALPPSVPVPWMDWLVPTLGVRYARYDQQDRPNVFYDPSDDLLETSEEMRCLWDATDADACTVSVR